VDTATALAIAQPRLALHHRFKHAGFARTQPGGRASL
jgi:hypothetical protein